VLSTIIGAIIIGAIIGPLARLVMPGEQDIGLIATILIGAVGALAGGAIYEFFGGEETGGIDWILHGIQVVSAAVLVAIWISFRGTKSSA
jgi:uncharacterized membrane protein YeaQ/YmgE (transglycosylase-associated protein family)